MVEQEEHDTIGVHLLKNFYCLVDLCEELVMIPPFVAACTWICNAACVFHHNAFLIADNKTSIVFLNEIRDINESPLPFLHQFLPSIFVVPFQVLVEIIIAQPYRRSCRLKQPTLFIGGCVVVC